MAVYRVVDDYILSESEYQARIKDISEFMTMRAKGQAKKPLALGEGRALSPITPKGKPVPFEPVGINLPLTVLIRDVYTGRYPENNWFKKNDLALVSGLKNYAVFDATARAVNFIKKGVPNHSHIVSNAFEQGTPLVANSPAITTDLFAMSIEFAVANFPKELIDHLTSAFQSLAGVPVLMPFAGYLLGASSIMKLAGGLGDALFGPHVVSFNESLNFNVPGSTPPEADFRILCNPPLRANEYKFKDGIGIVDKKGNPYRGDEPYVVVSLDGKPRPDLKNFSPTVASAAILQKFFQLRDGAETTIDTLVQGIKLVSDMKYRNAAIELKKEIEKMKDGPDKVAAEARYNAMVKNIFDDALKP